MKTIFRNPFFMFILGALLFGGIVGVSAFSMLANDIGYKPSDASWKVDNVKDAIDSLYNMTSNIEIINQYFSVDGNYNLRKSNTYTVNKKGKILIYMNFHVGIKDVNSNISYTIKKNNDTLSPSYVSTDNWNRIIYYIIEVNKNDVITYSASTQKKGSVNSLGILEAFIGN